MKQFFKIFLMTIGALFLSFVLYFLWLAFSWPANPTSEEQEAQYYFEQRCFKDSLQSISSREKFLCDSMLNSGYQKFEIVHKYYYSPCAELNFEHRNELILDFKKNETKGIQPSRKEIKKKCIKLIIHIFTSYVPDEELINFTKLKISAIEGNEAYQIDLNQDELNKLCGFKLISTGKNKWKRISI